MDNFLNKKNQIEQQISDIVLKEIEEERLTKDASLEIIQYCLPKIEALNTQQELLLFLSDLSSKWPVFANLATLEQGKTKEEKSDEVARNIASIAQAGNIDEAVNLAKAVTNN